MSEYSEILSGVPHQKPFRFVDEILEVNEQKIMGAYTFSKDESFYAGHFPEFPVTPAVIMLETMCQIGILCHAIYLGSLTRSASEMKEYVGMFSDSDRFEVRRPIFPGQRVIVEGQKIFFRRNKLRSHLKMMLPHGEIVAEAIAAGMAFKRSDPLVQQWLKGQA